MIVVSNNPGIKNQLSVRKVAVFSGIAAPSSLYVSKDTFISREHINTHPRQVCFLGLKSYIEQKYIFKPSKEEKILDLDTLYKFKEVTIPTSDNLKIKSWYVKPQPGKPTMLFCHGQNCNITHHQDIVKFLYNNGYGGLLVDYRGFLKNPGIPSEQGLYDDAQAGIRYLNSIGINNSDIIVWGHSLGGGVASEIASKANYRGLVLESTFASINDMQQFMLSPDFIKTQPLPTRLFLSALKLLPESVLKLNTEFNNKQKIKTINYPILIVHSKEDKKVPVQMSYILKTSQPKARLHLFEKGVHHEHGWSIDTISAFLSELS